MKDILAQKENKYINYGKIWYNTKQGSDLIERIK